MSLSWLLCDEVSFLFHTRCPLNFQYVVNCIVDEHIQLGRVPELFLFSPTLLESLETSTDSAVRMGWDPLDGMWTRPFQRVGALEGN